MKAERLWLQKRCIALARNSGGSALNWLGEPLYQLGGWMQAVYELNEGQETKPMQTPEINQQSVEELFKRQGGEERRT